MLVMLIFQVTWKLLKTGLIKSALHLFKNTYLTTSNSQCQDDSLGLILSRQERAKLFKTSQGVCYCFLRAGGPSGQARHEHFVGRLETPRLARKMPETLGNSE